MVCSTRFIRRLLDDRRVNQVSGDSCNVIVIIGHPHLAYKDAVLVASNPTVMAKLFAEASQNGLTHLLGEHRGTPSNHAKALPVLAAPWP